MTILFLKTLSIHTPPEEHNCMAGQDITIPEGCHEIIVHTTVIPHGEDCIPHMWIGNGPTEKLWSGVPVSELQQSGTVSCLVTPGQTYTLWVGAQCMPGDSTDVLCLSAQAVEDQLVPVPDGSDVTEEEWLLAWTPFDAELSAYEWGPEGV